MARFAQINPGFIVYVYLPEVYIILKSSVIIDLLIPHFPLYTTLNQRASAESA
jgi:hypothetical protein